MKTKYTEKPEIIEVSKKDIEDARSYLTELLGKKGSQEHKKQLKLLLYVVNSYLHVVGIIKSKKASIQKLKNLIFGSKTEKEKSERKGSGDGSGQKGSKDKKDDSGTNNSDGSSGSSSSNESNSSNPSSEESSGQKGSADESKKREGGTGRNSHNEYEATAEIICPLSEEHKPGEICPACNEHKLYKKEPLCTIRLIGSPPVEAIRFIEERSACVCGVSFKGTPPDEHKELFDSPKYTASALSSMIHLKYDLGVPFGALSNFQEDLGVSLPASTQSNQIRSLSDVFSAVFSALKQTGANMDVIGMDDTPIKVLEGRENKKGEKTISGHGTVFLCNEIDGSRVVVLYYLDFQHAGLCLLDLLKQRQKVTTWPICISDGAPCYEGYVEESDVTPANCHAHSRRKFFPDRNVDILCAIIIACYREIYKSEKFCREEGFSALERQQYHKEKSQEALDRLKLVCEFITLAPNSSKVDSIKGELELESHVTPAEPNSDLFKDAKYVLDRWEKLTNFTRYPGVPLDTNRVENRIKAIIEIRKKGLFFKTLTSAKASGEILSLIETAHANQKNSNKYIQFIVENQVAALEAPEKFLPWNFEEHPLFELKPPVSNHPGTLRSPDYHSSIKPVAPLGSSLPYH